MGSSTGRGNSPAPVAFWLLPSAQDEMRLTATIERLALALAAPRFEPHLTLFVTRLANEKPGAEVLDSVASRFGPLAGTVRATQHGPQLFRSLFLLIDAPSVHGLHVAIRDACGTPPEDFSIDPHISLLYKILPETAREALAEREDLTGERIIFDRVATVVPAEGAEDFNAIEEWRVSAVRTLRGPG